MWLALPLWGIRRERAYPSGKSIQDGERTSRDTHVPYAECSPPRCLNIGSINCLVHLLNTAKDRIIASAKAILRLQNTEEVLDIADRCMHLLNKSSVNSNEGRSVKECQLVMSGSSISGAAPAGNGWPCLSMGRTEV